jgi:hypothetical protein
MYSWAISGAQRLPNGNTLICDGIHGIFVEATSAGETVWKYVDPVTNHGSLTQGDSIPQDPTHPGEYMNMVFRVQRYSPTYQGLIGRDLTPGDFIELYPTAIEVADSVLTGWNMISLPVTDPVPDDSAKHVFPTIASRVFQFSNGYVRGDTLGNGIGYWGKFPNATTQLITGTARTRDSISVSTGWNMVGSISTPIDTSTIVSVPAGLRSSNWFGYTQGYFPVGQITPGKGYWVKSSGAGKFVFGSSRIAGASKVEVSGTVDVLNSITITDSKGGTQTLYFGVDEHKSIPVSMYAMPPLPPVGGFDARFETTEGGSMVQTHGVKVTDGVEFPVVVQSDAYPLTISWRVENASYTLTDDLGGRVFKPKEMRGEGSTKITNSNLSRFTVKLTGDVQLPREFALWQNYPNPFNPSTTMKYDLPVDTRVRMKVFDILGQEVVTLVNEDQKAGYRSLEWNATNVASGVYFYRIEAGGFVASKKLLIVK